MAQEQEGTESLTVGGVAAEAAKIISLPSNFVVESLSRVPGGSVAYEDVFDADGAFHTRITYERGMDTVTLVGVGDDYTAKESGQLLDGTEKFYCESITKEYSRGPIRITLTATQLPTE